MWKTTRSFVDFIPASLNARNGIENCPNIVGNTNNTVCDYASL